MSRIGRMPVAVPAGVNVTIDGNVVTVKGPKGTLSKEIKPEITVRQDGAQIIVERGSDDKISKLVDAGQSIACEGKLNFESGASPSIITSAADIRSLEAARKSEALNPFAVDGVNLYTNMADPNIKN